MPAKLHLAPVLFACVRHLTLPVDFLDQMAFERRDCIRVHAIFWQCTPDVEYPLSEKVAPQVLHNHLHSLHQIPSTFKFRHAGGKRLSIYFPQDPHDIEQLNKISSQPAMLQ